MSAQEEKQVISYQEFRALNRDIGEMKTLMSKMVDAISRISLLDERQQSVTLALQKLDERMARMESKQQEADIARALSQASADRLNLIDMGFRELHIERERDKARFQTVIWMIRGLWATVTAGGLTVAAKLWTA
jgi:hypothetical protein